MARVTRKASDASDYRELVKAAEKLCLTPVKHRFYGSWETKDEIPCWPGNSEVKKAGYQYFHTVLDGETVKIQPKADGYVAVVFEA